MTSAESRVLAWGGRTRGRQFRRHEAASRHRHARLRANDRVSVSLTHNFERLEESFFIRPDAEIPAADYIMTTGSIGFRTDNSKFFSLSGGFSLRDYFGGARSSYEGGIGLRTGKHLNLEAGISHDTFDLPIANGAFDATTFQMNVNLARSRKLFAKAHVQYDNFSGDLQANIRIDWIHSPGADLFLVFNANYDFNGEDDRFDFRNAQLNNRVGVAKLTYVVQTQRVSVVGSWVIVEDHQSTDRLQRLYPFMRQGWDINASRGQ